MEIKTKKARETKKRIIVSAQKLFHKSGFEATSVREIVKEAGCAKGTFYLYFETKIDLLIYITNNLFKNFDDAISKELSIMSDDPFSQIDNIFDNICLHMQETDVSLRLFHTREVLGIITEQNLNNHYSNLIISKISKFINEGIERGFFRQLDPAIYGKIIFDIGHQILESAILYEYPADIKAVKSEISVIIRKILEK
ncbi:TetR/AcrR family transcriptional regulator [Proteiniborus sp. MB09-C3]|uniref:TetR/AcrR family transcriptional regulator n=1 Tax=Proteiniborus sp. MB09-C3 TaxID=3050072 RepID=UPI002557955F|nr:TetR/AcrR family transcriptional regulator [Proteiniborus sp. MB09-C3]WIV12935.1 TetR/AcrR family transcriptional regulator [Proteiniborus sp. MB09-C3]